ncbi:hypothetical protein F7Q99_08285 [Streptomyces kaniharaensis]|uniref:Uncharacterized protein n=1 Tax=Streptomyces kaniharaensis TaxID=212423 RepID=A0A6N7KL94_9ACTN|nr:hypothetical protein [Streptomyces kaniharaensis]
MLTAAVERLAEHCAAEKPARARAVLARVTPVLPAVDEALVRSAGRSAGFAHLLVQCPQDAVPTPPDGPGWSGCGPGGGRAGPAVRRRRGGAGRARAGRGPGGALNPYSGA